MTPDSEDRGVHASEVGGHLVATLDGFVAQSQAQLKLNPKITRLRQDMVREGRMHEFFNLLMEKREVIWSSRCSKRLF